MVEELSSEEIEENIEIELVTEEYTDIDGQVLAVSRSNLYNRRVDYFIRIYNGELQERQDFYDEGRLFHSSEWSSPAELYLSDGQVKVYGGGSDDGMDPVEWAEGYSQEWLYEYTTELWIDNKRHHDGNTN